MVDNISNVSQSRPNQVDPSKSASIGNREARVAGEAPVDDPRPTVDVELSKAVQEAEERAVFDAKKVDSIKEAIQKFNAHHGAVPWVVRAMGEHCAVHGTVAMLLDAWP